MISETSVPVRQDVSLIQYSKVDLCIIRYILVYGTMIDTESLSAGVTDAVTVTSILSSRRVSDHGDDGKAKMWR